VPHAAAVSSFRRESGLRHRVIQWATGGVGRAAIEGILDHPELDLVGCWVHSKEKAGRDVGEILGRAPIGVRATRDVEALLVFAGHAALAIVSARRYQAERRRADRLALVARVGQIVTSDLVLDEVLQRAADAIGEQNPVIIAGFGRFGQVVQRVLAGMKIRATVVDHDPNQIELVRRFGNKIYFGDATRLDLLLSAKTGEANDSPPALTPVTLAKIN